MSTDQIQTRQPSPARDYRAFCENFVAKRLEELAETAHGKRAMRHVAEAFVAAARMAKKPEAIYNCSMESIGTCMITSAETGILPGGPNPLCWLVPKGGNLGWWLSHRGVIALADRAGYIVSAKTVHTGDEFAYEAGTTETIRHIPNLDTEKTWENLRCAYAVVRAKDGGMVIGIHVMTRQEIAARRNKAMTQDIWGSWPVEMALKTVIKGAASRGILMLDTTAQTAMEADLEYIEATTPATVHQAAPPVRALSGPSVFDDALGEGSGEPSDAEKANIAAREREQEQQAK